MKRNTTRSYFMLVGALFILLSFSKGSTENIRGSVIGLLAPFWESTSKVSGFLKKPVLAFSSSPDNHSSSYNETEQLKLENQQLRSELLRAKELLQYQTTSIQTFPKSIPARVIFRSPSSWNSSLWLNVGEADNEGTLGPIIAKNSPVMLGTNVVGIVDYVGAHQSRVRLITDSGLTPSVRAVREVSHAGKCKVLHLAKGELHGSGQPLWRTQGQLLQGVGFNYDFADVEGPARDLRTGQPVNGTENDPAMAIIQVNDLLVTTGMDGVFPADLSVAKVIKVHLLKEGDYFYELEAKPTAGNLDDLSLVFVIPPVGFIMDDQPPQR